jgi:hypothetical protein
MDKIPEFIAGVRLLLPGIIVATIFYLYSNAKFDQFFFIVFCVIFVALIGTVSRILIGVAEVAAGAILSAWAWFRPALRRPPERPPAGAKIIHSTPLWAFALELAIAVALGLLMVKSYENDFTFKIVNRIMSTEKLSAKDTLDYVSDQIAKKDWLRIDQRPDNSRLCSKGLADCDDDVYVRIRSKGEGDIYEGAFVYYQSSGERVGMFLSPACVRRRQEQGKTDVLQAIAGPGVYVNVAEIHSIEYWATRDSECFKLFYPSPKGP